MNDSFIEGTKLKVHSQLQEEQICANFQIQIIFNLWSLDHEKDKSQLQKFPKKKNKSYFECYDLANGVEQV